MDDQHAAPTTPHCSVSLPDALAGVWKGQGGSFAAETEITSTLAGPLTVHTADLDDDGYLDVVAAGAYEDEIVWFGMCNL